MTLWRRISRCLRADGQVALVTLTRVDGSAPRDAGTRMVVDRSGGIAGTVGGGQLEYMLHRAAMDALVRGMPSGRVVRHVLGPDLGQCCGGVVEARIEVFETSDLGWIAALSAAESTGPFAVNAGADAAGRLIRRVATVEDGAIHERFGERLATVALFGAGHVGRALVLALAPLPFAVEWIDSRADAFPERAPGDVRMHLSAAPEDEVAHLAPGTLVAVMTHSHAIDLAIVAAALLRADLPYVGLIGSATKRGRFLSRLRQAGMVEAELVRFHCPIGGRSLHDKSPAVIAAQVAVELLAAREALAPET